MNLNKHLSELAQQGYTILCDALSVQQVEATRRAVIEVLAAARSKC